jgi:ABC-2 type transport system ATP-binding protein
MTALENRPGILDVAVFGGGLHVKVEGTQAGSDAVRSALAQAGISVTSLESITPSMEDVFVSLIEKEEKAAA